MNKKRKSKKGFTLIELIAVMAIIAIIGSLIMYFMLDNNRMFLKVNTETILQDESRLIFSSLEDNIRVAKNQVYGSSSGVAVNMTTINSVNYTLPNINGSSSGKVIYKFTKKKNVGGSDIQQAYAYLLYGRTLIFTEGNSAGTALVQVGTLTKNLESISLSNTSDKVTVDLKLKNGSEEENFKNIVSPRN